MVDAQQRQYERLVRDLAGELYRYAYALCGHRQQAEDLVQETYLRAWKGRHGLRDARAARAWLYTILQREHARYFQRMRPEPMDLEGLHAAAAIEFDTRIEAFSLRRALDILPSDYREPLLLQVLGGFSCAEIAEMLSLTPGSVMTRLSRARRRLRERLAGEGELADARGARS